MKKSMVTKQKIEDAALELFFKKGFNGATTSEIAEAAGVAEGTIFRYFPTKKTILSDLMIKFIERFGEKFILDGIRKVFDANKGKPLEVLLKAIILDRYELFKKNSDIAFVIFSEIRYHPDLRESFKVHVLDKVLAFMAQALREIEIEKEIREDVKDVLAIRSFVGAAFIAIVQREFFYSEAINGPFEEELDLIIDIYLNGVKKR